MPNLTDPPGRTADPLLPPVITPYFRRQSAFDEAVRLEEARRGLPPAA